MIDEIMEYNRKFVENKGYEPYLTSKYPDKKLAILTCMDTRLLELLPAALGIKNGDAKIIKNAGGVIVHPYGSVVRSLLVGILELGVEEVMVIGHTDCGVQGMDGHEMLEKLVERGIDQQHIDIVRHSGIDLERWLGGFESVESSVHETVRSLKEHPLMPKNVRISGFIMDSATGELTRVEE
ncbi:MAG: beta-class carbonic anhydrase [Clostridium sp.]|nr:carbonic anhydrase [Clostridiaceae bacterium]